MRACGVMLMPAAAFSSAAAPDAGRNYAEKMCGLAQDDILKRPQERHGQRYCAISPISGRWALSLWKMCSNRSSAMFERRRELSLPKLSAATPPQLGRVPGRARVLPSQRSRRFAGKYATNP